ncbi:unnamed protein product [Peronospora destructor]|uniref:Uncharacterized protein n=1 Tax=Peronospora destructor TaxID=86335 RepID=A0AAV0UVT8_9STRA|nr:unnamed protein product [Peronospora destructor]
METQVRADQKNAEILNRHKADFPGLSAWSDDEAPEEERSDMSNEEYSETEDNVNIEPATNSDTKTTFLRWVGILPYSESGTRAYSQTIGTEDPPMDLLAALRFPSAITIAQHQSPLTKPLSSYLKVNEESCVSPLSLSLRGPG